MKFFLFGIIPAFDLLANLIIFSSDINPSFDLNQVAEFSLILAISVIISAFVFGGVEQAIDHKSSIPTILIGRKEWVIIICLFFVILIASIVVYELDYLTKIISLACLLGFRGLGRAAFGARTGLRSQRPRRSRAVLVCAGLGRTARRTPQARSRRTRRATAARRPAP